MAVDVPAGEHEIALAYGNPTFLAGGALSLASLLAVVLFGRPRVRA
jgi:uncharacterized membrane protein YfhO